METRALAESAPAVPMAAPEKHPIEEMAGKQGSSTAGNDTALTPVAESPKVSKMALKAGVNFVIPKNKLSGALIPVTKSGSKWEPCEPKKEDPKQPVRKTKWGPDLTQDAVVKRGRALALQTRAEQLAAQLESGNLEIETNEALRSPSPPPIYDSLGHRMNTREGRKREQLDLERREAIGECLRLNPSYKPPSGYKAVSKEAKLFIPAKEYPGYNFIGLILGPRGNTQKRMEAETGAKITIRGKGAVKEGKLQNVRRDGKEIDGAFEDLHVHITADTFEKVDAAVALIAPLLTPVDEDRNTHKMKQLRELAEMNGTIRDFTLACTLCGEIGHKEWQCPKDKLVTFQAKVICRLCGDGGHPTIDCPLKVSGQGKVLDKEYLNFLQEINGGLGSMDPPANTGFENDIHPPGASSEPQPMLLTASGAQPMPTRWAAPGSDSMNEISPRAAADGAIDTGGFPRFPFPIPPPGRLGRGGFNFFLSPFFHPGLIPFGGKAFLGGRAPLPFPPMMALGPRGMFPPFRGRFPFPPFGLRPDMRPPSNSTIPDIQPASLPMDSSLHNSAQQEQDKALGRLEGGTSQGNAELVGEPQVATDARVEVSAVSSTAIPSFSLSATAPPLSLDTAPPNSSASLSTIPSLPSKITTMPTFSSIIPPAVPPSSALPPPVPPPALPPVPPAPLVTPSPSNIPMSSARHIAPSVRPALPSVRPAVPPAMSSSSPVPSSLGPSLLPSGLQAPSFTPVGALGQAHSVGLSPWDGASNSAGRSISSAPRPPNPVATHPIWSQASNSQAPASPQQSSPQVFAWQQQMPRPLSQAGDESLPSKPSGYAPPPLSFATQVTPVSFPRQSLAPPAAGGPSSVKPWGNTPPNPPLPPGPGPIPVPSPPLLPSQTQSFPRNPPIPTPSSVPPVFPGFTPVRPQTSQDHFGVPPRPPATNSSNFQPPVTVPHDPSRPPSNYSIARLVPPPLPGLQIRPSSSSNATPSVLNVDRFPVSSLSQKTPAPLQSFSFHHETPLVAGNQLAYASQQSTTPEIPSVRLWPPPYVQPPVSLGPQPSAEFRGSTGHQLGYVNIGTVSSSSSFSTAFDDVHGLSRPSINFPQTGLDRENSYHYNPSVSTSVSAMSPALQRQPDMRSGVPAAALDQNIHATPNFKHMNHMNPHMNVRPAIQQAWVQHETGLGQKWPEDPHSTSHKSQLHSTGMSQTQEVDPEYEKLMASVGVT